MHQVQQLMRLYTAMMDEIIATLNTYSGDGEDAAPPPAADQGIETLTQQQVVSEL